MDKLLPCPFCGGPACEERYDRMICIGCNACGYKRHFDGLLSSKPSGVKVNDWEFYHADANEKANAAWNMRAAIAATESKS